MTEYTQITEVIAGPTELFVAAWCKPAQYDEHTKGYRYYQFLQDCKKREANVREEARKIIQRMRDADEVRETAYLQAAE